MSVYESNAHQLVTIAYSLFLGVCIALLYTLFEVVYGLFTQKKRCIILRVCLDIVFSTICTLLLPVFLFVSNSGKPRAYILLTLAASAFVIYKTVCRQIKKFLIRCIVILCIPLKQLMGFIYKNYKLHSRHRAVEKYISGGIR